MNFDTHAKAQVELYQALWKKEEEKPEIWLGLLDRRQMDDYSMNEVIAGRFTNNLGLFKKLAEEKAKEQQLIEDYYNE